MHYSKKLFFRDGAAGSDGEHGMDASFTGDDGGEASDGMGQFVLGVFVTPCAFLSGDMEFTMDFFDGEITAHRASDAVEFSFHN